MTQRILIIGSGGREHAWAMRLANGAADSKRSDREIFVCPGNGGIAQDFECIQPASKDIQGYVSVAEKLGADLVVVGPEQPLTEGLVEALQEQKIDAFGPDTFCSQLEGSKSFMKMVAQESDVPTASYGVFEDVKGVSEFLKDKSGRWVVKADGLCAGKGVTVCDSPQHTLEIAKEMLGYEGSPLFGNASQRVVVEEFLEGTELSLLALCDGERAHLFAPARDHKQLLDGNKGPNTGGMGAVAPVLEVDEPAADFLARMQEVIFQPVLNWFKGQGHPYRGILYAGLMVHEGRAKLLEFNVRFGDPEAQAILWGTQKDLLPDLLKVSQGQTLGQVDYVSACAPTCIIVLASPGYPEKAETGHLISGLDDWAQSSDYQCFFAGVTKVGRGLETSGGRVLGLGAQAADVSQAVKKAYEAMKSVRFDGMQWRTDIGTAP